MPTSPPRPPSPPWLRLVALVVLGHAALLTALAPLVRPLSAAPEVRYWLTRAVSPSGANDVSAPPAPTTLSDFRDESAPATPTQAVAQARVPERWHTAPAPRQRQRHTSETAARIRPRPVVRAEASPARAPAPKPTSADGSTEAASSPRTAVQRDAATLASVQLPGAATLNYTVSGTARGLPYAAQSQLRWQPQDGRYEAEWLTQGDTPRDLRRWRSEGSLTSTGLMPTRFAEKARSERAAHFDAAGGRIRFSANTPDIDWAPGGQDRLSAILQLAALVAAAPAHYPPGSTLTLQIAGVRDALPTAWTVQEDETLVVDGQAVPCTVLVHVPERPYEPSMALWLARPLQHLPARLRTTSAQGDVVEHNLQTLAFAP